MTDATDQDQDERRHDAWTAVASEGPRAEVRARALAAAVAALPPARPSSAADAMRQREENERAMRELGQRVKAYVAARRGSGSGSTEAKAAEATFPTATAAADVAADTTEAIRDAEQQPSPAQPRLAKRAPSSLPPPATGADGESRKRARTIGLATMAALALAAGLMFFVGRNATQTSHGDVTAQSRTEVSVGNRARAVLEPNAHVVWNNTDEITQSDGSVFYRVEPGTTFRVHTPVGDVTVLGTCFRIKVRGGGGDATSANGSGTASGSGSGDASMNKRDLKAGVAGAVSTAIAFVAVYEGKVAVSHAGQSVTVVAGEAASLSTGAPKREEDGNGAERSFDEAAREEDEAKIDPAVRANKNLVASVSDYRARLEKMDVQKRALEQELAEARDRLAAGDAGSSTSSNAPKNEVSEDEWKELAKDGTIKMRVPCNWKGGWWPPPNKLNELGLSRDDGPTIQAASNRLYESSWSKIKPVCEKIGGRDLAEKLGLDGCPSFIFNYMKGVDKDGAMEAMRRVSEMRAGMRPTIAFEDPQLGPVEKVFLVMTGEQQSFEADLAKSFGPEEAHRIVTSDSLCSWSSTWNGPGPRKAPNQ